MRYLLLGLALTAFSAQLFGQASFQEKQSLPPLPYQLNPPPAAPRSLSAPGEGLPFKNWQELLKRGPSGAEPHTVYLNSGLTAWAASGHCSVPLLSIPLPEHLDDKSIHKLPPHYDDKMLLPTPPVCPLHDDRAQSAKHK
jgi:hypothetical protein